ncbi:hypothetical protein VNO77_16655 [Canavalia gladiata]|uniref:Uncharacterized protein n=1 Tax=Canavalia gladiata TaxID=3824 RepID=A0AAN9QI06_CANGL
MVLGGWHKALFSSKFQFEAKPSLPVNADKRLLMLCFGCCSFSLWCLQSFCTLEVVLSGEQLELLVFSAIVLLTIASFSSLNCLILILCSRNVSVFKWRNIEYVKPSAKMLVEMCLSSEFMTAVVEIENFGLNLKLSFYAHDCRIDEVLLMLTVDDVALFPID